VWITVLQEMSFVKTPPVVSIPRIRGQTSTRAYILSSNFARKNGRQGSGLIWVDVIRRLLAAKVLLKEL
jgi:hypothetical protein